ncbi:MAG TPA: cytochrome c oxidase subunit 3, partial [Polyangiaceae bacterium]
HKWDAGLLPGHYFHPHAEHLKPGTHIAPEGVAFFSMYFMMTGVHAIHIIVGIGVLIWMLKRNLAGEFSKEFFTPIDITALYWHLVDLIWIYLFPLLYLID